MILIILDTEDRAATIDYLRTRNACLVEDDITICENPECTASEHYVAFENSDVFSCHDADNETRGYFKAAALWKSGRKLDPLHSASTFFSSDLIAFCGGWLVEKENLYMNGGISYVPAYNNGKRKPAWFQEEYKLLARFIKKRTVKYPIAKNVSIYLSPSIEEKWKQGEIAIFNMGLYEDYIKKQENK